MSPRSLGHLRDGRCGITESLSWVCTQFYSIPTLVKLAVKMLPVDLVHFLQIGTLICKVMVFLLFLSIPYGWMQHDM